MRFQGLLCSPFSDSKFRDRSLLWVVCLHTEPALTLSKKTRALKVEHSTAAMLM